LKSRLKPHPLNQMKTECWNIAAANTSHLETENPNIVTELEMWSFVLRHRIQARGLSRSILSLSFSLFV